MDDPSSVFGNCVILELKFTGRFPDWFGEMVRVFGLRQGSASKYADGIAVKGEHYFLRNLSVSGKNFEVGLAAERKQARLSRLARLPGGTGVSRT
jgi:hypothetical protein